MQRTSQRLSWESDLQSPDNSATWPHTQSSPIKLHAPPKQPHLTQSSSPSFLQAYAKYIEQKRDADKAKQLSDSDSPVGAGQKILAFARGERDEKVDASSPDTRKEATDSSYSSWPASSSTVSPSGVANAHTSAESLPSPTSHAASRFRQAAPSAAGGVRRKNEACTLEPPPSAPGAVAAAVDALETRFRESSQEPVTPQKGQPLLTVPVANGVEKLQTSSAPSSPWPHVHYEPSSPRRNFSVEVCVIPPSEELGSNSAAGGLVGDRNRSFVAHPQSREKTSRHGLDEKLSRILRRKPQLREELLRLLQAPSDDASLGVQVQDLMRSHPDLVETLNAQFKAVTGQSSGLREALLSTASMHLVEEDDQIPAQQGSRQKTYMVVVRGIESAELQDVQEDLQRARSFRGSRGRELSKWLVPPRDKRYFPWSTCIVIAAVLCIFFFMAGGYADFLQQRKGVSPVPDPYLPAEMGHWLSFSTTWRTFDFDFLLLWGGQYLPAIAQHQGWRWITAVFVHASFMHLLGNMLLFGVLGGILERRYGALRMLLVMALSAFGAAFFAGAFADECTQVVGASGTVLGFVGLTVADLVVNFGDLRSALMRLVITAAAIIFFIVTAVSKAGDFISNWSHLGGFVCGLFPSFLFLPNLEDRRWRKAKKLAAKLHVVRGRSSQRQQSLQGSSPHNNLHDNLNSMLSPHPMRSQAAWLDPRPENNRLQGGAANGRPLGGIALPGMTRDAKAQRAQEPDPVGNDHQPGIPLSTQDPLEGARQGHPARPFSITRPWRSLSGTWRAWLCPWSCAVLPCVVLGAFIMIGVFASLPTYIYVVRLPNLQCTSP